jgi:hypothetical protein
MTAKEKVLNFINQEKGKIIKEGQAGNAEYRELSQLDLLITDFGPTVPAENPDYDSQGTFPVVRRK